MPVAVILGASSNRQKYGNKSLRAHQDAGFTVLPIHPTESAIEGIPCFPSIQHIPNEIQIDRFTLYLPPEIALEHLADLQRFPYAEIWLNPGVDRSDVVAKAQELGLNVILGCSILAIGKHPNQYR